MWYAGLVLSFAGLGGSSAGPGMQGERRFSIYCPGLEGSSIGSRAQGHCSHTVQYGRITQGRIGASIAKTHAGSFVSIF